MPILLVLALAAGSAQQPPPPERFAYVAFDDLVPEEAPGPGPSREAVEFHAAPHLVAYAALDVPGEAVVDLARGMHWQRRPSGLAVRTTAGALARGRLFLARPDFSGFEVHPFAVETSLAPEARARFFEAAQHAAERHLELGSPGEAWFRRRAWHAWSERGDPAAPPPPRARGNGADPGGEALEVFTGARALAENLDLDRKLEVADGAAELLDVDSLRGIETRAMDWKPLVAELRPALDPQARCIAFDQHALFVPSLEALLALLGELESGASALRPWLAGSADVAHVRERYARQLCLPLAAHAAWGARIRSIAITGSDPYLPSGSDVALLIESMDPRGLSDFVRRAHARAAAEGASAVAGTLGSLAYTGVATRDRSVSSYAAACGDLLVVCNSLAQLERIAAVRDGKVGALADLDEYRWFRDRYRRGDAEETALLVLGDAVVRRWSGPRVRIGESRRERAAAALRAVHVRHPALAAAGPPEPGAPAAEADLPDSADFVWDACGARSPRHGTLQFATPIAELSLDQVTRAEAEAYESFRTGYEARWSRFLDPIALRVTIDTRTLALDATVVPLVVGTEYQWLRDLAAGAHLGSRPDSSRGDLLFQLDWAMSEHPGWESGTASWLGSWASLRAERHRDWQPFLESYRPQDLLLPESPIPLALHVGVADDLALCLWMEEFEPTELSWRGHPLVTCFGIYATTFPGELVLTLNEATLRRVIERRLAGVPDAEPAPDWGRAGAGLLLDGDGLAILENLLSNRPNPRLSRRIDPHADRHAAWSWLPILAEMRRLAPQRDVAETYARLLGERLRLPAADAYAWDEAWQTHVSARHGAPAVPLAAQPAPEAAPAVPTIPRLFERARLALEIEFEGEGLRARASIDRLR